MYIARYNSLKKKNPRIVTTVIIGCDMKKI